VLTVPVPYVLQQGLDRAMTQVLHIGHAEMLAHACCHGATHDAHRRLLALLGDGTPLAALVVCVCCLLDHPEHFLGAGAGEGCPALAGSRGRLRGAQHWLGAGAG